MLDIKKMDQEYYYEGEDLGCVYGKDKTTFRVWAPLAQRVDLNLYEQGDGDCLIETIPMMMDVKGTWFTQVERDLSGLYYDFTIRNGEKDKKVIDLYARSAGVNGKRAMILDFRTTDPDGWEKDAGPELVHKTDAVIYELHVRDLSADSSSGISHARLFEGLQEEGTVSPDGLATGLDHIKEMGVTHVHLLPLHDFGSVDETDLERKRFNWGYDPCNYSVLEGSYSSDPYHGEVRVKEFKRVVQKFHQKGIGVIMDVVYNHTYQSSDSAFEETVPGYYYRMKGEAFADGSGCGNETASDHRMMRKFIVDSLCFWAKEYHIDGFRFDLMGIHDIETMNQIAAELKKINPDILLYGEGWAAEPPMLERKRLAMKENAGKMPAVAMFNDNIRDTVKGHVFEQEAKGFVNGEPDLEEYVKFAVVGATKHRQAKNGKDPAWAVTAEQSVNYISAHDDLTLWDKLALTNPEESEETRKAMNRLAAAIVFTSQGIPFFQAGEEMLRTKPGMEPGEKFTHNSYNAPDSVNSIKWQWKKEHADMGEYYKGLIAFRKAHAALRMVEQEEIEKRLQFLDMPKNVVGFTISCEGLEENLKELCIVYNANPNKTKLDLPKGDWQVYGDGTRVQTEAFDRLAGGEIEQEAISVLILGR